MVGGRSECGAAIDTSNILRWEDRQLGWHDPATGRHITTFEEERDRADREQNRADQEHEARIREQNRADQDRAARVQAEAELKRRWSASGNWKGPPPERDNGRVREHLRSHSRHT